MDKQKLEEARQLAMSMTSHPVAFGTIEHTEKAGELLAELVKANEALAREAHEWWTAARDAEKRAQRVPLDPLDIEEMWDEVTAMNLDDWHQEFARRIERRHGIGGEHD